MCIVVFAIAVLYVTVTLSYEGVFFPRTTIADIDVSGKTPDEAYALLKEKETQFRSSFSLTFHEHEDAVAIEQLGFSLDPKKTIVDAYKDGRSGSLITDALRITEITIQGTDVPLAYSVAPAVFNTYVHNKLIDWGTPHEEARVSLSDDTLHYTEGQPGTSVHQKALLSRLTSAVQMLGPDHVSVPYAKAHPKIAQNELMHARSEALTLSSKPLTLRMNEKTWELPERFLKDAVTFNEKSETASLSKTDYLESDNFDIDNFIRTSLGESLPYTNTVSTAHLDTNALHTFMEDTIAPDVTEKPRNARFTIKEDNSLELLEESTKGKELLHKTNIAYIEHAAMENRSTLRNIPLHLKIIGADVTADTIDDLGITELIATGESNFAGSSSARRHNINTGMNKLNGVLVKPGDTYSLLEYLGEVGPETGYLPELVIKPGETIKEYGGGLCQVGTTMFRGAMNSGLEITVRQWHSYPVEYYKPYGTDATIYNPSPDFRFFNDTENYILIQGEMEGNTLRFKFYGKKDGREVRFEGPDYWDHGWAGPGSLRAKWTQVVTMPDGTERKKTFYSFYKSPDSYH